MVKHCCSRSCKIWGKALDDKVPSGMLKRAAWKHMAKHPHRKCQEKPIKAWSVKSTIRQEAKRHRQTPLGQTHCEPYKPSTMTKSKHSTSVPTCPWHSVTCTFFRPPIQSNQTGFKHFWATFTMYLSRVPYTHPLPNQRPAFRETEKRRKVLPLVEAPDWWPEASRPIGWWLEHFRCPLWLLVVGAVLMFCTDAILMCQSPDIWLETQIWPACICVANGSWVQKHRPPWTTSAACWQEHSGHF